MSVKQTTTTYHCDGCGAETTSPYEWRSFGPVGFTGGMVSSSQFGSSEDYCSACAQKMRAIVRVQGGTLQVGLVSGDD